jgi:predicted naringenin-chalcone synthase
MLIDIAMAVPPFAILQTKAAEELKKRMADRPAIARMIDSASIHSGIHTRHVVVPDADENPATRFYGTGPKPLAPGTGSRMEEYEKWTKILGLEASRKVLTDNAFPAEKIGRLITISCTGFFAPGLDCYLIKELNLPATVRRTHIGFMGCAASLIGLNAVLEARGNPIDGNGTLLVSVELCSLHMQTQPTRANILANTIFADGSAAALFSAAAPAGSSPRFELLRSASLLFGDSSALMGWKIGNTGFDMILSPELPTAIRETAVPALIGIFSQFGISKEHIAHWALHPGGRAVLDALQEGLGLGESEMQPSRNVLRDHGNMSSASILYVLKEVLCSNRLSRGELCCAIAFGPGLTMEVILLEVV